MTTASCHCGAVQLIVDAAPSPQDLAGARVRQLDGATTERYLDEG